MLDIIFQNIILGFSLAIPIGGVTIAAVKSALKNNFKTAFLIILGAVCADITYLLLVYFGLSSIIQFPFVKTILYSIGAFMLSRLAYLSIKDYKNLKLEDKKTKQEKNSFFTGYLICISNPMTIFWWIGVFGSIISQIQGNLNLVTLLLSLTIEIGVILWFIILLTLIHFFKKKFLNDKILRYFSLAAGLILLYFAAKFGINAVMSLL
ncbi:MAG: LysE family transporter [Candidatus Nanoarchaeia archaeon]|jgi:threonine/homoserine/homoserine lactone efflux protein